MGYKIAFIGTGYVGLVSGACFAKIGHNVTCIDKDNSKITKLLNGEIPIYEPGLDDVVKNAVAAGNLKFRTEADFNEFDAIFLAVGTPTDPETDNADMRAFFAAAKEVAAKLTKKTIIVTKSTVPVGTGKKLAEIFGDKAAIVSNPEFLREGSAVEDFMNPDRVVIGATSVTAKKVLAEIYAPLKAPIMQTSIASAELIKYASNSFLAAKVVFINEMADLCEKVGADIEDVAAGMGSDSRIGNKFLKAGPGIGGSCFPKDARALGVQAKNAGVPSRIINGLIESNELRKIHMAERIIKIVGLGKVAVLGLTFKANTDDMRESASLTIIPILQKAGLKVVAYDPEGMEEAKKLLNIDYAKSAEEAANGADAIVILTEWDSFKKIDYNQLKLNKKVIIDLRNILDASKLSGFEYYSVGRECLKS